MLDLSTAVLCDFAQVRDRLLFVSSGAVSRLYRQELPSPLGLMVGLVIEVPLEDAGMEHRLRAEVINRHGTVLATLENLFRVSDVGLFPHEVQQVPLVLSITGVRARTWGTHQVRLHLDDDLVRALTLYVVPAAGPQAVVRATPTQSRVADDEGSLGGTGTDGVEAPPAEGETVPVDDPAPALPWGAPIGVPVGTDADDGHEIVIDLDTTDDGPELVTIVPEATPTTEGTWSPEEDAVPSSEDAPAPAPEPVAWDTPAPEPEPAWAAPAPEVEAPSPWAAPAPALTDETTPRQPAPAPSTWDAPSRTPEPSPWDEPAPAPEPARTWEPSEPEIRPGPPSIAAPARRGVGGAGLRLRRGRPRRRPGPADPGRPRDHAERSREGEEPLLLPVPVRRGRRDPELSSAGVTTRRCRRRNRARRT